MIERIKFWASSPTEGMPPRGKIEGKELKNFTCQHCPTQGDETPQNPNFRNIVFQCKNLWT